MMSADEHLRKIARLIKTQEHEQAYLELQLYLHEHPNYAPAWVMLSLVAPEKQQKIRALQQALRLDPDLSSARKRLARLTASRPARRSWRGRAAILLGVGVLIAGVILFRPKQEPDRPIPTLFQAQPLPTAVAYGTPADTNRAASLTPSPAASQTPTLPAADRTEPAAAAVTPTQAAPTLIAPIQAAPTQAEPTSAATAQASPLPSAEPHSAVPPSVVPQTAALPSATATLLPPAALPSATPFVSPTPTAALSPSATATLPPPTATLAPPGAAIPLNVLAALAGGKMMVVSAVHPADSTIRDLGGTAPALPAGSEWLLVELLVQCAESTCGLASAAIQVVNAAGTAYLPDARLQVVPTFSSGAASNGQVWGYLGFVVPQGETPLYLWVTQNAARTSFALQ